MKETYQNIKYKVNIPLTRILRYICWMGEQSEFVSISHVTLGQSGTKRNA